MALKFYNAVTSRWRLYLSVGTKTLCAFSLIIAVLAGGFYYYIDTILSSQARNKAEEELITKVRGAAGIYRSRMGQMKYGMLQAGSMESVQRAVSNRDGNFLSDTIDRFAGMRPYVDFWAVVDSKGRLITVRNGSALASEAAAGQFNSSGAAEKTKSGAAGFFEINGIVERALSTGEAVLSTEVVPLGRFAHGSSKAEGVARAAGAAELMQVVVTPVKTGTGVAGAFVTGILLDGYGWLTGSIDENFAVESALFDFTGDSVKLITSSAAARTLLTDGTSPVVTIGNGLIDKNGFSGSVEIDGTEVFMAVEPLFDSRLRAVGGIAVTIPGTEVFAAVVELKGNLTILVLVSVLFSVLLAWRIYRNTTRPISALVSAMDATTGGELNVRVDIRTKDEFERIGAGFNTMIESIEVREAKLNHFVEFVRILIGSSEPDGLIKDSLEKIVQMTGSGVGVVYVKDRRSGIMWPAESIGLAEGELDAFICDAKLTNKAESADKSAVYVNKVDEKMLLQVGFKGNVPEGLEYFVMCSKGLLSGVFMVGRQEEAYRSEELDHIDHLVTQFAIALDNSYTHKEVERLSITDPLTGLYNRRYFHDRFKLEFNSANRYSYTMAVLMIDIDDFKSINDTYGHQIGDTVLKKVSSILVAKTRTTDIWARYGGEEFIGFVSHCNAEGTVILAEKIRSGIEATVFEELGERKVTVSIGMGLYPCAGVKSYDDIVKVADDQLYLAKSSGKNMVSVSQEQLLSIDSRKTG